MKSSPTKTAISETTYDERKKGNEIREANEKKKQNNNDQQMKEAEKKKYHNSTIHRECN